MQPKKTSPFRYAIGMFGTSIPINMFKTYAAAFYVIKHGVTTAQFALVLFLYTFLDAIDNPIYGFLSDRTRTRWGRRRPGSSSERRCWFWALLRFTTFRRFFPAIACLSTCC